MNPSLSSEISRINTLLKKQQERFDTFKPTEHLSSYLPSQDSQSYNGTCDEMTSLIEQRLDFIENRKAVLDDALFMIHNIIKKLVTLSTENNDLIACIKTLENNKHAIEQRFDLLNQLDTLYKCLVIEPAVISIPDGERTDPSHFHVIIAPISSLSEEEAQRIHHQWWQDLQSIEHTVVRPIQLKLINPLSDE